MEQESSSNNQQGQQVTSQSSESLGNGGSIHEQALSRGSNLPPRPVSNELAIQTQGGTYIAGSVTNQGGTNIYGGNVTINQGSSPTTSTSPSRPKNYIPFFRNSHF